MKLVAAEAFAVNEQVVCPGGWSSGHFRRADPTHDWHYAKFNLLAACEAGTILKWVAGYEGRLLEPTGEKVGYTPTPPGPWTPTVHDKVSIVQLARGWVAQEKRMLTNYSTLVTDFIARVLWTGEGLEDLGIGWDEDDVGELHIYVTGHRPATPAEEESERMARDATAQRELRELEVLTAKYPAQARQALEHMDEINAAIEASRRRAAERAREETLGDGSTPV